VSAFAQRRPATGAGAYLGRHGRHRGGANKAEATTRRRAASTQLGRVPVGSGAVAAQHKVATVPPLHVHALLEQQAGANFGHFARHGRHVGPRDVDVAGLWDAACARRALLVWRRAGRRSGTKEDKRTCSAAMRRRWWRRRRRRPRGLELGWARARAPYGRRNRLGEHDGGHELLQRGKLRIAQERKGRCGRRNK
jgi:hypothetical protein